MVLETIRKSWPWLKHLFADGAYDRASSWTKPPISTSSSKSFAASRSRKVQGSATTLGRERTFGWMTRWRRLVRDYEANIDVSEAMIHLALGSLLLRRIAHQAVCVLIGVNCCSTSLPFSSRRMRSMR